MGVTSGLVGRPDRVPDVTIRRERAEFGDLCTWAVGFWPSRGRERRFVTLCTGVFKAVSAPSGECGAGSRVERPPSRKCGCPALARPLAGPRDHHEPPQRPPRKRSGRHVVADFADPVRPLGDRAGGQPFGDRIGGVRGHGDQRRRPPRLAERIEQDREDEDLHATPVILPIGVMVLLAAVALR
jgi:hypothetical protein